MARCCARAMASSGRALREGGRDCAFVSAMSGSVVWAVCESAMDVIERDGGGGRCGAAGHDVFMRNNSFSVKELNIVIHVE